MEEWKDIKDFEGFYQVSNLGRVKSLKRIKKNIYMEEPYINYKEIILKPCINSSGIRVVFLKKDKKKYTKMIGRLVYETFTGQELNKTDLISYKDKDKKNCSLENLYIIKKSEQMKELHELGRRFMYNYDYYNNKDNSLRNIIEYDWADVTEDEWYNYYGEEKPKTKAELDEFISRYSNLK